MRVKRSETAHIVGCTIEDDVFIATGAAVFHAARLGRGSEVRVVKISWPDFRDRWRPGLERDGLLVGINWSGPRAHG
jgi:hypothetical protein